MKKVKNIFEVEPQIRRSGPQGQGLETCDLENITVMPETG